MAGPTSTLPHLVGAFRQRGGPHVAQPNPVGVIRASVVGPTLALPNPVRAFGQRAGAHVALPNPVGVIRACAVAIPPASCMWTPTNSARKDTHTHVDIYI